MIYLVLQLPPDEGKEFIYQFTLNHFQNRDTRNIVAEIFSNLEEEGEIDILTIEQKHFEFFSKNQKKGMFIQDTIAKPEKLERMKKDVYRKLEERMLLTEKEKLTSKLNKISPGSEDYQSVSREIMEIYKKLQDLRQIS